MAFAFHRLNVRALNRVMYRFGPLLWRLKFRAEDDERGTTDSLTRDIRMLPQPRPKPRPPTRPRPIARATTPVSPPDRTWIVLAGAATDRAT
jgi:hypothetical protein